MRDPAQALLHGSLQALVLRTLNGGPRHGYGIARWIEGRTDDVLSIEEGSLYPTLYRLEREGLVEAEWGTSELNRRIKLYRLTGEGRARLAVETAAWDRFQAAVSKVLLPGGGTGAAVEPVTPGG